MWYVSKKYHLFVCFGGGWVHCGASMEVGGQPVRVSSLHHVGPGDAAQVAMLEARVFSL